MDVCTARFYWEKGRKKAFISSFFDYCPLEFGHVMKSLYLCTLLESLQGEVL